MPEATPRFPRQPSERHVQQDDAAFAALGNHEVRIRALERECDNAWFDIGDTETPPFQNGWSNVGAPYQTLRYRLQGCDLEIQGSVTGGTPPSVVFTLPPEFSPSATLFAVGTDDTLAFIVWQIDADGSVWRL